MKRQIDKKTIQKRANAVRNRLTEIGADCLLLAKPANVTYVTGFRGEDSWAAVTNREVYLLTDSRYTEQVQKECPCCKIIKRADSMTEVVAKLLNRLKSIHKVALEESVSFANYKALRKNIAPRCLKAVSGIVETLRSNKDSSEAAAIRTAASLASRALSHTLRHIKPGMTENELAGIFDFQVRKLGAINGFSTIVAFGPNASRPHHQSGKRRLKRKDTVLIDFGVRYEGYLSDITRSFAVGRPTAFYKKVYNTVEKAQAAAIRTIKAGVGVVDVDAAAREVIAQSGLPVYGHGSGHGVGLEIHELPFLKEQSKARLEAGQILTVEPGVYLPGKLGVRIEDDVLVTKTGCEVITRNCPHSILLPSSRQRFFSS